MSLRRPITPLMFAAALFAAEPAIPPLVPAPAQEAPAHAPAKDLSLAIAIDLALKRNETPKIAAARISNAEASLARAHAALLPQLTVGGSIGTTSVDQFPRGGKANETTAWSATASLGLLKASAWSNEVAAKYSLQAQQLDSREMRRVLTYMVSDVYLTVLASERQVIAAERRLEVARASVADAKARLQAGISTRTDVTRAELGEAQSQLSLTQAKRAVIASREALSNLVVLDYAGVLVTPPDTAIPGRDFDTLVVLAHAYRSDLRALKFREDAAHHATRAARARYVPDVTASAEVGSTTTTNPMGRSTNGQTDYTLALTATWTLYDGGDREGAIDEAVSSHYESTLNYTAELRALTRNMKTAIADLNTAEDSLLQAEARNRLARANAEEVRARYKQGLATALEDADAISGQFDAESGFVSASLDLERSRLEIRKLVGYWPQSDRAPDQQP
ncbi:MAG: TolC family protein [Planctomycetota bacterium]